jgi:hypothetical protein
MPWLSKKLLTRLPMLRNAPARVGPLIFRTILHHLPRMGTGHVCSRSSMRAENNIPWYTTSMHPQAFARPAKRMRAAVCGCLRASYCVHLARFRHHEREEPGYPGA